jgi:hypothetical protein
MKYILSIMILVFTACDDGFIIVEDNDASSSNNTDTYADQCEDVLCDDPPDNECTEDGDILQYTGEATCIEGVCHYSYIIEECDWGCEIFEDNPYHEDGADCVDPCDGFAVCDDPPDGYCDYHDTTTLWAAYNYNPVGWCEVDELGNPYCEYYPNLSYICLLGDECQVIGGVAQCVLTE